jgi:hypothetical protein
MGKITTVVVRNSQNGVVVDPDSVELSVGAGDTIHWVTTGPDGFDINFGSEANCPFDWPDGKKHGSPDSGLPSGPIRKVKEKVYSYNAEIGKAAADPEVSIKR